MDRSVYQRIRELETVHWWFVGRRRVLESVIQDLALPSGAQIVEVGCGTGGNLPLLGRFGAVRALEPDADARAYAASQSAVQVEGGLLPDGLPFEKESFDLVCAFDVVEHVDDDKGAVAALAGLAKPGGYVLTTVPAYQWMWSHHDELHHHKRRYRKGDYARLFQAAGMEVVRATYFNALLFPLAVAMRFAKKLTGANAPDDALPGPGVNSLLTAVFSAERGLLGRTNLPAGLSILVLARKAG